MSKAGRGFRWRRWLGVSAAMALTIVFAWWQCDYLLVEIGKAWSVNNPARKTDAIVVLGGGLENRPEAAANIYRSGVAPLILYMNVKLTAVERMGIDFSETEYTRRVLLSNGVPQKAMENIGTNVASTYDEAKAVRDWAQRTRAKSIEIVTDVFHTRRARWVFQKELKGTGVEIHIAGVPTEEYDGTNWWRHEEGVIAFQNEIVKYLYYQIAH